MSITAQQIKQLRERTNAPMIACKKALEEVGGDQDKAVEALRKRGLGSNRSSRLASEGIVGSYIHIGGRIGALVEVNCETDFAARTDAFQNLVNELAMQVAAANPTYVQRSDVPSNDVVAEKRILRDAAAASGKPEHLLDRIVSGQMEVWFRERCLLEQDYIRDRYRTIRDLLQEVAVSTGEQISVRRFVRFELGEGMQKADDDFCGEVVAALGSEASGVITR